jgi:protein-disulfide isomerase
MSRMNVRALLKGAVALALLSPLQSAAAATAPHAKPSARDWTRVVSMTSAGGFVVGNPQAKVKLVEYGSMTCPHCKRFDDAAGSKIADYVKAGRITYEFRNYVRDAGDVAASLIARCGGSRTYFGLTRALYKDQESWQSKLEATPQDKLNAIQDLPANKEFLEIAKAAGLVQWASARGVPVARSTQCLTDEKSVKRLIQMNQDAKTQYPGFKGTPTFLINGSVVDLDSVSSEAEIWPAIETQIKATLGQRG